MGGGHEGPAAASPSGIFEAEALARVGSAAAALMDARSGGRRAARLHCADLRVMQGADGVLLNFSLPEGCDPRALVREFTKPGDR